MINTNTQRTNKMRLLKALSVGATIGLASIVGCNNHDNYDFDNTRHKYAQSSYPELTQEELFSAEDTPLKAEDYAKEDIKGFGEIRKIPCKDFNLCIHNAYKTQEGSSVVQLGAFYYLINQDGKLLTTGSHRIQRVGNSVYTQTGAIREMSFPPTRLEDIESDTMRSGFEERSNGVYVKLNRGQK